MANLKDLQARLAQSLSQIKDGILDAIEAAADKVNWGLLRLIGAWALFVFQARYAIDSKSAIGFYAVLIWLALAYLESMNYLRAEKAAAKTMAKKLAATERSKGRPSKAGK